jgi:lipopolysaccharide export system permease protein
VFKKLDKLIVKAFVGPFIATFFITLLVLVMQFFWLYIDDFVGKGLSIGLILEFIWYQSAVLVPLALPLSVLLSSLMTFGNLGETYELVAIKSAGISLLRFMRPLFFVTIMICGVAFLFSNYIIPVANLKSRTLLSDIVFAKPSFDIKEGVFYDRIYGFAIKIGKKDNDTIIRDVIIYEQSNPLQDNFIIAKGGVMRVSDDKRFLEFNLNDGIYYQEKGNAATMNTEYIRSGFKEYKKQFDLSSFQFQRTADSVNKNNHRMLSMRQLSKAIDSMSKQNAVFYKQVSQTLSPYMQFIPYLDSTWKNNDSIKKIRNFNALFTDSLNERLGQNLAIKIDNLQSSNDVLLAQYNEQRKVLRQHQIEWHRKISLSLACVVLFLIGAPLGSIIRKGGLGSPLVLSVVFFMVFYFLSNTGEKMAKAGTLDPKVGMWLSTFVLVPIGLFLINKALKDSQLFNKEYYFRAWQKFRSYWQPNRS